MIQSRAVEMETPPFNHFIGRERRPQGRVLDTRQERRRRRQPVLVLDHRAADPDRRQDAGGVTSSCGGRLDGISAAIRSSI